MDVRRGTVDGMWAVHLTRSRSAEPLTTTVGLRMPLDFRCAVNPRPFCLAVAAGRPAFFFFSLSPPFCACSPAHLPSRCHCFTSSITPLVGIGFFSALVPNGQQRGSNKTFRVLGTVPGIGDPGS